MGPAVLLALRTLFSRAALSTATRAGAAAAPRAAGKAVSTANPFGWTSAKASGEIPNPFGWATKPSPKAREIGRYDEPRPNLNPFFWDREPRSEPQTPNPFNWQKPSPAPPTIGQGFKDLYRAAMSDATRGAAERFRNSTVGQMYHASRDFTSAAREFRQSGAPPPNGASYPSTSPSDLMGMAGRTPDEIAGADEEARKAKMADAEQRLLERTQQLTKSFKGLLDIAPGAIKIGIGVAAGAAATNRLNAYYIDSQAAHYGRYDSTYANIGAQRRQQEIQIDRRTAMATSGSANALNQRQMQGQEIWSRLNQKVITATNTLATFSQMASNVIGIQLNMLSKFSGLDAATEWWEKANGKKIGENDQMADAIKFAVRGQQQARDNKRREPLKGVR